MQTLPLATSVGKPCAVNVRRHHSIVPEGNQQAQGKPAQHHLGGGLPLTLLRLDRHKLGDKRQVLLRHPQIVTEATPNDGQALGQIALPLVQ